MKINIGCGKKYESNYVNVDFYESLVADHLMSATNLEFEDNICEEVRAIQLIEHLTYFETIYALSEFYRILKPGGNLIIETPDLKKACERYITSKNEQKMEVLGWLYGIPHKGLQHKICFPPFLLTELLENSGFEKICTKNYINEEEIPTITFTCQKSESNDDNEIFQSLSNLRKNLLLENKVVFTNSYLCKEQEDIILFIGSKLLELKNNEKRGLFYDLILKLLIYWPEIIEILMMTVKKNSNISKFNLSKVKEAAKILVEQNSISLLYNYITEAPIIPGSQKLMFVYAELYAKKLVEDFLYSRDNQDGLKKKLTKIKNPSIVYNNQVFSATILEKEALDFYYLGIKAYSQQNFNKAQEMFLNAIKCNRDNFKFFWYLSKTLVNLEQFKKARRNYKNALRLLEINNIKNKNDLKSQIQKEIKRIPIKSLRN